MTASATLDTRVIEATDLVRHFATPAETVRAVDGVSLTLDRGEIAVLAGRSGSGKSTLLNLLLGWDRPDGGTVIRHLGTGHGWATQAVVPQGLGLLPELTARQNIEVSSRLADRRDRPAHIDELVVRLELDDLQTRRPSQLSHGEQQRVAVVRALSCRPTLLVADEPTAHQDERRGRIIMDLFRELAHGGAAVLVASHDDAMLEAGDRRFDLDDGRLV